MQPASLSPLSYLFPFSVYSGTWYIHPKLLSHLSILPRYQRSDVRYQKKIKPLLSGIAPAFWSWRRASHPLPYLVVKRPWSSMEMYLQSLAKSSQVSVSLFSPSASVNLLIKCATYLLFASPSCMRARDNVFLSILSVYLANASIASHTSGPVLWNHILPTR